jgi:hypothetical protein
MQLTDQDRDLILDALLPHYMNLRARGAHAVAEAGKAQKLFQDLTHAKEFHFSLAR